MKTFSLIDAFKEGYLFISNNIKCFFASSIIIAIIMSFVDYIFLTPTHPSPVDSILALIIIAILQIMFISSWIKLYLKKIRIINTQEVLSWNEIKTKYLIAKIKLYILPLLLLLPGILFPVFITNFVMLFYFALILTTLITVLRLSLILPSIIAGEPISIRTAFIITKGNALKIFFTVICVSIPSLLVIIIISIPFSIVLGGIFTLEETSFVVRFFTYLYLYIALLIYSSFQAVTLAYIYKKLS